MFDPRRAAIDRFAAAAVAEPLVAAAFLGGSFAAGTADAYSDLDLYVLAADDQYDTLFTQRDAFLRSWGEPVFTATTVDFEGLGFDMLHFVLADGVDGELAMARASRMLAVHGGPHTVLVDKHGLLEGVTFPLYEPSAEDRRAAVGDALTGFWSSTILLAKYVHRGDLPAAQGALSRMRDHCDTVVRAANRAGRDTAADSESLLASYVGPDLDAIAATGAQLGRVHVAVGTVAARATRLEYPRALAAIARLRLESVLRPG